MYVLIIFLFCSELFICGQKVVFRDTVLYSPEMTTACEVTQTLTLSSHPHTCTCQTHYIHTYTHYLAGYLTTFMTSQELLHVVMDVLSVRESNLVVIHYVLVLVGTGLELDHMELEWGMKHGRRKLITASSQLPHLSF